MKQNRLLLILFCCTLIGCRTLELNDKTQSIITTRKLDSLDCFGIIPPKILTGNIDFDILYYFQYTMFDGDTFKYDETTIEHKEIYTDRIYNRTLRFFNKKINCNMVNVDQVELNIIYRELNKIKAKFRKERLKTIIVSDSLINVLNKYDATKYLLFDIEEYYTYVIPQSSKMHDFCLMRVYLIDKKTKEIIFYNYKIEKHFFHFLSNNSPHINRVLRKLRHLLPAVRDVPKVISNHR
jgi:hypothetical protein